MPSARSRPRSSKTGGAPRFPLLSYVRVQPPFDAGSNGSSRRRRRPTTGAGEERRGGPALSQGTVKLIQKMERQGRIEDRLLAHRRAIEDKRSHAPPHTHARTHARTQQQQRQRQRQQQQQQTTTMHALTRSHTHSRSRTHAHARTHARARQVAAEAVCGRG